MIDNPGTFSELVLDDSFDSSSEEAQVFLKDFCESMLDQDFATPLDDEYTCPLTKFDSWLQVQSSGVTVVNATTDDAAVLAAAAAVYEENCNGATGIPMSSADWNNCVIAWSKSENEMSILSRSDEVAIIFFPFVSRVRYDDPYDVLDKEWNMIEDWVQAKNSKAPKGVHQGYFTSYDFWWYDTNGQMLSTAYSSAAMALGCAAFIILASSKSIVLTLFCTVTIGYVLTSVTALLVAIGWTLGFLESICFAILIGVSVDFVIHLAHAYACAAHGEEDREVRIKYALIHMGPSILATALTTVLSAIVMLFTVITFFQKFALILFLTIVQAFIGSFIVFVVMADCLGPRNPTYVYDRMVAWWSSTKK
jgi:MMPL family